MSFKKIALCVICTFIMTFAVSTVTASAQSTSDTANEESKYTIKNTALPAASASAEPSEEPSELQTATKVIAATAPEAMPEPAAQSSVYEQVFDAWSVGQQLDTTVIVPQSAPVASAVPESVTEDDNIIVIETGAESSKKKESYTKAELRLMSAIIYCEAGSESYAGKLAVGIVIMNRKESSGFPDSVKGVIYQRHQFTPARSGALKKALASYDADKFDSKLEKQCIKAAKAALSGTKSVEYKGKTKSISKYRYFSGYIRRAKYKIGGHMFK